MSLAVWFFLCFAFINLHFHSPTEAIMLRDEVANNPFDNNPFPTGIALKETSEPETSLPTSTASIEQPIPSSVPTPTITYTSLDKVTAYTTVFALPDALSISIVTETETSYYFTSDAGSVVIETGTPGLQSTITLTAYEQEYLLSSVAITPMVTTSTEYFTITTTIEPVSALQPSTTLTTATTTLTDTITVTGTLQASNVLVTTTDDYYTTELSISTELSLQTEVLMTITNYDGSSVNYITVNSLVRNRPYYLTTENVYTTETYTIYTTTTTQPPTEVQSQPTPDSVSASPSSSSSSSAARHGGGDPFGDCMGMPPGMLLQCEHRM